MHRRQAIAAMAALLCPFVSSAEGQPDEEKVLTELGFELTMYDRIHASGPTQGLFIQTGETVELAIAARFDSESNAEGAIRIGFYESTTPERLKLLTTCPESSGQVMNLYGIETSPPNPVRFQAGSAPFGLYVQSQRLNPEFSNTDETVFSQSRRNRAFERFGVQVRKMHLYPYRRNGLIRPDWFVITVETSTDQDFQDLIMIIRGVQCLGLNANSEPIPLEQEPKVALGF